MFFCVRSYSTDLSSTRLILGHGWSHSCLVTDAFYQYLCVSGFSLPCFQTHFFQLKLIVLCIVVCSCSV